MLAELALFFRQTLPDIHNGELVETFSGLRPNYITLWKWRDDEKRFVEYPSEFSDGDKFFYQGDFRARRTPQTHSRFQELTAMIAEGTEGQDRELKARFEYLDRQFAALAIAEARSSVSEDDHQPHPKVGAVVVRDGAVLASAHRGEVLGCHAEFIALEIKLGNASLAGATVYTTLEPCTERNHPKVPCATRLVERKVKRVVIGMLDPNPLITGRGQLLLREANIITDFFPHDLMTEVEELNRDFKRLHKMRSATEGPLSTGRKFDRTTGKLKPTEIILGSGSGDKCLEIEIGDSECTFVFKGPAGQPWLTLWDVDRFLVEKIEGKLAVSTTIRNEHGKIIAELTRNEWKIRPSLLWDKNFSDSALEVRDEEGHIVLQVQVLLEKVRIQGIWRGAKGEFFQLVKSPTGKGGLMVCRSEGWIPIQPLFLYPSELHQGELAK
jgi:pyrimidine deaminase RibD-like protein